MFFRISGIRNSLGLIAKVQYIMSMHGIILYVLVLVVRKDRRANDDTVLYGSERSVARDSESLSKKEVQRTQSLFQTK